MALFAFALLLPLLAAAAQERPPRDDARRQRWEALPEPEKRALRERFEQFRRMPREEQERMRARSGRLEGLRARMEALLPEDTAAWLHSRPVRDRFETLRAMLETHVGERRDLIRRLLPPPILEKLKADPSPERAQEIRRLLGEARHAVEEEWLRDPRNELPPGEKERIGALPPPERFRELLRLRKDRTVSDLESRPGLLDRLPPDRWRRIRELPPHEFFPAISFLRLGGPGRPGPRGERGGPPPLPPFMHLTREERERIDSLPADARRAERERLSREKARRGLEERLGVPAEEAERISNLPFDAMIDEVVRRLPDRPPGPPGQRPPGPRPPGSRPSGPL